MTNQPQPGWDQGIVRPAVSAPRRKPGRSGGGRSRLVATWLCVLLAFFSFGDTFGVVLAYGMTVIGFATLIQLAINCLMLTINFGVRGKALSALAPLALFVFYSCIRSLFAPLPQGGYQTLATFLCFLSTIALGASLPIADWRSLRKVTQAALWFLGLCSLLYAFFLAKNGLESNQVLSARIYAINAMLLEALLLSAWKRGSKKALLGFVVVEALVTLSLSRTSMVIGVLLLMLAYASGKGFRSVIRLGVAVTVGAIGFGALIFTFEPLRNRFVSGDVAQVGGVGINMEGRLTLWQITLNSARDNILWGKGSGSAGDMLARLGLESHPHNDYLKILHDYGAVGLVLFCLAIYSLFRAIRRARSPNDPGAGILNYAAELGLVAMLCTMTTDNLLTYDYFMTPLAIFIGVSITPRGKRALAGGRQLIRKRSYFNSPLVFPNRPLPGVAPVSPAAGT